MNITQVRNSVQDNPITYTNVQFPLFYSPNEGFGFYKTDGTGMYWFRYLLGDGLTYLLYRLEGYVDRKKARRLLEESPDKFVEYINACRGYQETEHPGKHNAPIILAVAYPKHHFKKLWGVLTHYNPVSNDSVLERIEKSPLATRISDIRNNHPKEIGVYFHSRYVAEGTFSFGLVIMNGETGHRTLSYNMYVSSNKYQFLIPMKLTKRHLSQVGTVNDILVDVLDTLKEVEIDQILEHTESDYFIKLMPDKVARLLSVTFDKYRYEPVEKLLIRLVALRSQYGYTTAVNKALDLIFKESFKLLGA